MGYCTVESVKAVLQISDDKWDSELSECIASLSAFVYGFLARDDLALLSVVPQVLVDAVQSGLVRLGSLKHK